MKTLALALILLMTASSTTFAQKNPQPTKDPKQLIRQINELKVLVEKLKADAAAGKQKADLARLLAEKQRAIAAQRQKDIEAEEKRARAIAEKQRQIAERRMKEIQAQETHARALEEKRRRAEKGPRHPEIPKEIHAARERLENLRLAIDHLNAAGMKDLAAEAAKRAEHMQDDLNAAMKRFKDDPHAKHHEKPHAGAPHGQREIHEAIRHLHEQVKELRQAVERLERKK